MGKDDWRTLLSSDGGLTVLYDEAPELSGRPLTTVHFSSEDEGASLTMEFVLNAMPDNPPEEWVRSGANTVEFWLHFTPVHEVSMSGFVMGDACHVSMRQNVDASTSFEAVQPQAKFSLHASEVRVARLRAFRAGAE
ncbi:hypothetical protein JJV70_06005 [Streptomyces sp. JJ66]|uniref:Imm50 family immunity protein n=1 Tax=Streptomyces sp. JJ66 TaxID=2803843 RepID=UPI001C579DBB|nr:Imm50 family immunity protein [Streptomyces sp. JJ66]MBW1601671.1 hypothetical protein [Streptomyces sp. JJ66]